MNENSVNALIPQVCNILGHSGQALPVQLTGVSYCLESVIWLQSDLLGKEGYLQPRAGSCYHVSRFLRSIPILRQEGGCSGLSGLPSYSLRGGRAIKATRRRWMTYPCSLSGRAGVRLQGSPLPSLGLFSRRQTGSSRTPRAL